MKKQFIALMLMFAFAIPFTAQAGSALPAVPAYVSAEAPTMQFADVSPGLMTTAAVASNKYRQSSAVAAVVKETTSNDAWEDRYASIGASPGGVSGGGSIGIGEIAA